MKLKLVLLCVSGMLMSCAYPTMTKGQLSKSENFEGKTGIITVFDMSSINVRGCTSHGGFITLDDGEHAKDINFSADELFAVTIPAGRYRVTKLSYRCSEALPNGTRVRTLSSDMGNDTFFNIPKKGFCKTYISDSDGRLSVGINDGKLKNYAENIPGYMGRTHELGLDIDKLPYCNLQGGDDFYPSIPLDESSAQEVYEDFDGDEYRFEWSANTDEDDGGSSIAKKKVAKLSTGSHGLIFEYALKSGAKSPNANLFALTENPIDLQQCRALAFDYFGAGMDFSIVSSKNGDMALSKPFNLEAVQEWRTVKIPLKKIVASKSSKGNMELGNVVGFVLGAKGYPGEKGKVFIDNIRCK